LVVAHGSRCLWTVCTPLFLLLGLAAAVRGTYLRELAAEPRHVVRQLEEGYNVAWARAAATGDWSRTTVGDYPLATLPTSPYVHPPGYPLFLAGVYRLAGLNRLWPLVVQQLLGVWVVWLAWSAARRWIGVSAGWFAGVLVALHWSAVYYAGAFLDASLLTALVMAFVVGLGRLGERIVARPGGARRTAALARLAVLGLAVGLAAGLAAIVRPATMPLLALAPLWLLWVAWRVGNPSLRAAAIAVMSQNLPPTRRVDEASDVLLASMAPSASARVWAALRGLPPALALAAPALAGIVVGAAVAIAPVTWRNWRVSGRVVPICIGHPVAALVAAMPAYDGLDDGDVGSGSRLDRVADYEHLALAAGSGDPRVIARHFRRQRHALVWREPEATARALARRLELFWGPLDVGSASVVECERDASATLGWLPLPFSVVNALAVMGLAFCAVPRRPRRGLSAPPLACAADMAPTPALVARGLSLLVFGILLVWTFSHLPLLAAGVWRQPLLPLLAMLAAVALEDLRQSLVVRRVRDVAAWGATLFCCWLVVGQNIGAYVPNRAKWHLDRGLALEALGQEDAAQTAFRTVLMAAPGVVDPVTGVRTETGSLDQRDFLCMRRSAAMAATKLAAHAFQRDDKALALQYYGLAAELDASRGEALVNVGILLLGRGNPSEAATALTEALQRDPGVWPARYPLAQALYRLGRYDAAREQLDELLKVMPGHGPAHNMRALLVPER
jgi:tetratricopeptide (TPR) repeat protein